MRGRTTCGLMLMLVIGCLLMAGCSQSESSSPGPDLGFIIDDPATLNDLHEDLGRMETSEWVEHYLPAQCFNGYTLVLYRRAVPMIIDMNGRVVHAWPKVRGIARIRLNRQGRLTVIGRDDLIKEYDWDGNLTWYYQMPLPTDMPHHDFIQLDNGNYLVLIQDARDPQNRRDHLLEVNRSRKVVWEWWAYPHLNKHFPDRNRDYHDPTHINSVQELPPNQWFDSGDERFRPGNILVSARNLNTVFIIDKRTGDIVWKYSNSLDFQHEALMIEKESVGAGLIVVFDNGYHNTNGYRKSAVVAIDPVQQEEVWRYQEEGFFTSVAGTAQPLPNGNVLITSSEGGRVFEITIDKKLVWEWQPPGLPMRAMRLPARYCPQLAALGQQRMRRVFKPGKPPFIDIEVFAFTLPEEHKPRTIGEKSYKLLQDLEGCRKLWMPPNATIDFSYGFDQQVLEKMGLEKRERLSAHFRVTLQLEDHKEPLVLLDDVVDSDSQELFRWQRYRKTKDMAYRHAEMCVSCTWEGFKDEKEAKGAILFVSPRTVSRQLRLHRGRPRKLSPAEQEHERKQLEAIGYVQ